MTSLPVPARLLTCVALASSLAALANAPAHAVTIDLVTVGDSGNTADTTGYGAVGYEYSISKYAVTINNYTAFLNSVAASDPYGLYETNMAGSGMITRSGSSGSYSYSVSTAQGNAANRPIGYVSWFDAARFANWITNGQPTGAQGPGTTETGGYTLNGATTGTAPARNPVTAYFVPSENEWYKAAYYDPTKGGSGGYWTYATRSDSAPGNVVGSSPNQANYFNGVFSTTQSGSFNVGGQFHTDVGAFTNSASYYGTFDQSGNSYQWNDLDGTANVNRGIRGGYWKSGWPGPPVAIPASQLTSAFRADTPADFNLASAYTFGLVQVAAVPEPSTYVMALAGLGCGGFSMFRRRKRA
jgi:hypothetical protein